MDTKTQPAKITTLATRKDAFDYLQNGIRENSGALLKEIEENFVDMKMAYHKGEITLNPRGSSSWGFKKLMTEGQNAEKKEKIIEACMLNCDDFESDPIERMRCFYRNGRVHADKEVFTGVIDIDCDACKSADIVPEGIVSMYELIWPDVIASLKEGKISADTMNSFFTLYKEYAKDENGKQVYNKKAFSEGEGKIENGDLAVRFKLFAHLVHTAGNFILCYGTFNRDRYQPTKDFWDLTLKCIRDWYLEPEEKSKNPLNVGLLDQCDPWLNSFVPSEKRVEGWEEFVRINHLTPFIEYDENDKMPKEAYPIAFFYDGHSFEEDNLFPGDKKAIECLDAINACIVARGNKIREVLHEFVELGENEFKAKKTLEQLFNEKTE